MTDHEPMTQTAPYPQALADMVKRLRYRQHLGWEVRLEDDLQRDKPGRHTGESRGLTLVVQRHGQDTYHPIDPDVVEDALIAVAKAPGDLAVLQALAEAVRAERYQAITVNHYFPVPAATYNEVSWRRWLFERLSDVDRHECMEDFAFAAEDGTRTRPLAPNHGPGWDPYLITVIATETDRRTSFRGEVNPE